MANIKTNKKKKGKQGKIELTNKGMVDDSKKGTAKNALDSTGTPPVLSEFERLYGNKTPAEVKAMLEQERLENAQKNDKALNEIQMGNLSEETKRNIFGLDGYNKPATTSSLTPKGTTTEDKIVDNKAKADDSVATAKDAKMIQDGLNPENKVPDSQLREGLPDGSAVTTVASGNGATVEKVNANPTDEAVVASDDVKPDDYTGTSASSYGNTPEPERTPVYLDEQALNDKMAALDILLKNRIGMETLSEYGNYSDRYIHHYNKNKKMINAEHAGFRRAHVFMTMPSCNMLVNVNNKLNINVPTLKGESGTLKEFHDKHGSCNDYHLNQMIANGNIYLAKWLCSDVWDDEEVFMFPLMNMLESVSGLPSFELKTRQSPMNIKNNYTEMAVDTVTDMSGQTVTLTFTDDKRGTALKSIYFWIKYMEAFSSSGTVSPDVKHAIEKRLPYTTTIYVFVTDETNSNLTYWWQLVGCFPKQLATATQDIKGLMNDAGKIEVPFKVSGGSFLSPAILADFNILNAKKMKAKVNSSTMFNNATDMRNFINKIPESNNYSGKTRDYYDDLPDTFFVRGKRTFDSSVSDISELIGNSKTSTWKHSLCMFNYEEYMHSSQFNFQESSAQQQKISQLEDVINTFTVFTSERPEKGWRLY